MSDQEIICRTCGHHFMGELGEDLICPTCREELDELEEKNALKERKIKASSEFKH